MARPGGSPDPKRVQYPKPQTSNLKPGMDGMRRTPPYSFVCDAFPREPAPQPNPPLPTDMPRSWAHPLLSTPVSRKRRAHDRGQTLWQEHRGCLLLLLVVATRGGSQRVLGATPPHLYGPPPLRAGLLAELERHRSSRTPPRAASLEDLAGPMWPHGPRPCPRVGPLWYVVGRVVHAPPAPMLMGCNRLVIPPKPRPHLPIYPHYRTAPPAARTDTPGRRDG